MDGEFSLYEDEGDNYNYEKGAFSTVPIKWNEATQTLSIGERKGAIPGHESEKTFHIVWVEKGHGAGVEPVDKPDAEIDYEGQPVRVKAPQ